MAAPLTDFVHVFRTILRFLRYAGLIMLGVTLWLIGREVVALTLVIARVHPALAVAFDVLVAILVWRLLGVPVVRFLRLPVVVSPPKSPESHEDWKVADVAARYRFHQKYLAHLVRNPLLAENRTEVRAAAKDAGAGAVKVAGTGM